MITGAILGFAGSLLPGIFKHFERRQDNKQELAVMEVQASMTESDNRARIDMSVLSLEESSHTMAVQADIHAGDRQGQTWLGKVALDVVAAWRAAMRPWIVTVLVCFYVWVKYKIVTHALDNVTTWTIGELAQLGIWTQMDIELLFLGVTFYLGKRGMEKAQGSR